MSSCFLFSLPVAILMRTKGSRGPLAQTCLFIEGAVKAYARRMAESWLVSKPSLIGKVRVARQVFVVGDKDKSSFHERK